MKRVLKLNKEVIASLNGDAMNRINGGDVPICRPTVSEASCPTKCWTDTCATWTCVPTIIRPCGL